MASMLWKQVHPQNLEIDDASTISLCHMREKH